MLIRFATSNDQKTIMSILKELSDIDSDVLSKFNAAEPGQNESVYKSIVQSEDKKILLAQEGQEILGVAVIYILPNLRSSSYLAYLHDFVITKKNQRQGIGTLLFKEIITFCNKINIKQLKLTTGVLNMKAQKFYMKNGGKQSEIGFRFNLK